VKSKGLRKTFFTGSNSSCRQHIRQHYELYKKRCKDAKIPLNHRAIPPPILKGIKAGKDPKAQVQKKLDGVVIKRERVKEFSRNGILEAVAKFVACDDQVCDRNLTGWRLKQLSMLSIVASSCKQGIV
jgi:hypothetical protein